VKVALHVGGRVFWMRLMVGSVLFWFPVSGEDSDQIRRDSLAALSFSLSLLCRGVCDSCCCGGACVCARERSF